MQVTVKGWVMLLLVVWCVMVSWRNTIVLWVMQSWFISIPLSRVVISILLIMWVELFDIVSWPVVVFTVVWHVNTVVVPIVFSCYCAVVLISTV